MFLTADELRMLTGRARKSGQIAALRKMGVPFLVNAAGVPVVTRAALEGGRPEKEGKAWMPAILRRAA